MTNTNLTADTAASLVASLPVPAGLKLAIDGDRIVMDGPTGTHSLAISVSSAERVRIHWQGYCEINGHKLGAVPAQAPRNLGAAVPVSGELLFSRGDSVTFASASSPTGWRVGTVVRATRSRVLVEFSYKGEIRRARRAGEMPRTVQTWRSIAKELHPHTVDRALRAYRSKEGR